MAVLVGVSGAAGLGAIGSTETTCSEIPENYSSCSVQTDAQGMYGIDWDSINYCHVPIREDGFSMPPDFLGCANAMTS